MQSLTLRFPAHAALAEPVHVGAVASGDLEILLLPTPGTDTAEIALRTSVDGFDDLWRRVLDRTLTEHAYGARYEINDFGATPGMVGLRLAQAAEHAAAQIVSNQAASNQAASNQAASNQAASNQAAPNQAAPNQQASAQPASPADHIGGDAR